MSPQAQYRERFKKLVLAEYPDSVLDVGCGTGDLIRSLISASIDAVGADPEAASADTDGLNIFEATAEALPFEDNSFDLVVSEFSLHHFTDFAASISECMRVARKHVMFLDCWYDLSIPSQQTAEAFDLWMKDIDQAAGEVHNPVLTAGEILSAAGGMPSEIEHWLKLEPMADEKFRRLIRDSLVKAPEKQAAESSLEPILAMAKLDGISEDGAIFAKIDTV